MPASKLRMPASKRTPPAPVDSGKSGNFGPRPVDQRWFTYEEAEHYFGIPKRTLRYYGPERKLLPFFRIGNKVRFLGRDIRQFFGTIREEPIDLAPHEAPHQGESPGHVDPGLSHPPA